MNAVSEKETRPLPAQPWQFSLRELMTVMLVLSIYLAAVVWLGPCMGVLGGLAITVHAISYVHRRVHAFTLAELGIIIALIATSMAMFMPAVQIARSSPRRTYCAHNLRQIGMALQLYHVNYNTFPPAYIADSTGKPMHSWRVLILKEIGRPDLYAQYRFNEPWDGPNNRLLHSAIANVYQCPSDRSGNATRTNYLAVIGPGTVFPDHNCTSMSQISDGTSSTLLVAEVHNSGVHWMEPRDLHISQMAMTINGTFVPGITSAHPSGANALYVDGHVEFLGEATPPNQLRARLTIAGNEKIIDD